MASELISSSSGSNCKTARPPLAVTEKCIMACNRGNSKWLY